MAPDTVTFRLGRARRVGLGCLAPLLCLGAFGMAGVLSMSLGPGPVSPTAVFGLGAAIVLFLAFGLLLAVATVQETPRAIRNDPVVIVGPAGLELTAFGRLAWEAIDRMCVERRFGSDANPDVSGPSTVVYRRLAIWPKDRSVTRHGFLGGAATAIQGFFGWAPLGVFDYELERPLDELIELIRQHASIDDCTEGWRRPGRQ